MICAIPLLLLIIMNVKKYLSGYILNRTKFIEFRHLTPYNIQFRNDMKLATKPRLNKGIQLVFFKKMFDHLSNFPRKHFFCRSPWQRTEPLHLSRTPK